MNKSIRECILNFIPKEHSWKIILLENWGNIIGDLKKSITVEQIREDVLFLGVVHPAWAQELLVLAPLLKQKINTYFDKEYVKTIRIKLKQTKKSDFTKLHRKPETSRTIETSLTEKETKILNRLSNEDLRGAMQAFYLKCKSHKVT